MRSQILIIGSGPAGYSAAIYAARASLTTTVVAGMQPGGQLTITTEVENFPGFAKPIQGPWLMDQMKAQAEALGVKIIVDHIYNVDFNNKPFLAVGDLGKYTADSVIIATGASAKFLGLKSEEKFQGFGVSACAVCDGFFYKNKKVLVVGGGNSAVEEALYLTNHASHVTLIHRKNFLRAEQILQKRLFAHPKITVIWNTVLEEVLGNDSPLEVTGAIVKDLESNNNSKIAVDGIFIAIGHTPNTSCFVDQLNIDSSGYIITEKGTTHTSVPGIFAAGDVQDKTYRQAVTAAGTGCMAALDAIKYLQNETSLFDQQNIQALR